MTEYQELTDEQIDELAASYGVYVDQLGEWIIDGPDLLRFGRALVAMARVEVEKDD